MKKNTLITLLIVCIIVIGGGAFYYFNKSENCLSLDLKNQTITFKAKDKVEITADLYMTENKKAPFILLFHQADASRGEYLTIAPKLNELGFNCMAVDQRAGSSMKSVDNKTFSSALALDKPIEYEDSYFDLEAALHFVKDKIKPDKIIVWGSSYSALLAFPLAANNAKDIDGILAFSPGDYFYINDKSVFEYSKNLTCPIFITSAKNEHSAWQSIFDNLTSKKKVGFIPETEGCHGSSALWSTTPGNEEYWKAVQNFLSNFATK
ncbi:MAG: alpha/beta fold hydrolase [Clostridium sp.]|uniref:alpha/beta hydrolase n=1 Tax=Clostridium sp. TaxID=1506 RepID=UPI003D6D9A03